MEEQVGELWHKLISRVADRRYPRATVKLPDLKSRLGIFYRALGGDGGLQLEAADAVKNTASRNWLQRIAGTNARIHRAYTDMRALHLPPEISWFEDAALNRDLYYWLAALAASAEHIPVTSDSDAFQYNQALTRYVLQHFPGLKPRYQRLVEKHIEQRPPLHTLTPQQSKAESAIRRALCDLDTLVTGAVDTQLLQSVPLWLHIHNQHHDIGKDSDVEEGGTQHSRDMRRLDELGRRKATRVKEPDSKRGLVTVRMENIFSMGEFINVDRGSEEDDNIDRAESVARDLDTLAISRNAKTATATLKFDLDLPASSEDDTILDDGLTFPEWDWKSAALKPDRCRVVEMIADSTQPCTLPAHLARTAKQLRQQFQALAPSKHWLSTQPDGQEIDIDACIRFACDRASGLPVSHGNFYRELRSAERDLSCLLLADLSLSTDAYIDDTHRVIDVIRDSLFLFGECLHANSDRFALYGFSSRKRNPVRVHRIKNFDENFDSAIRGRINAIKPGYYTRLGAGIRFATRQLMEHGSGKRLLLVLTDGKPNDLDQYEGRYGIEDTRHAVLDARRQGLLPFCVTIDTKGNDYLPHLFGKNSYVVIHNPAKLPRELPRLYALFSRI